MRMTPPLRSLLLAALFAFVMLAMPAFSSAQVAVGISVSFGPPPLPVYEQPLCPGEGYIWTPGYWAWDEDDEDYYWVPGTWVLAPEVGFLWTPPYWAWSDGAYVFYDGYWGPTVGFYGGIVYGFGYFGFGFVGGRWDGDRFFYNQAVTNVNVVNVRNVYNQTVNVTTVNHVSYNGGPGGVQARPRPEEERAAHERHLPPVAAQTQHFQAARKDPQLHASANRGKPPVAATARPAEFRSGVPAKAAGGSYNPPANRGNRAGNAARAENRGNPPRNENRPPTARGESGGTRPPTHAKDLPPLERPSPPHTGDPNRDRKYQQQQEKLYTKQNQERQKLEQRQEQEHQRLAQRNAPEPKRQQMEQRHQQQTQQLQQRHAEQQQRLQERQQPPPPKRKQ